MKIKFACECGKQLHVAGEHAGKNGKCPQCGKILIIPAVADAPVAVAVATTASQSVATAPRVASAKTPPHVETESISASTVSKVDNWRPPANSVLNRSLWSLTIQSPKQAEWLIRQAAYLLYFCTGGALLLAILLFNQSPLAAGGFLFDFVLTGGSTFLMHKRRSTVAALILLVLCGVNVIFSILNGGHQPHIAIALIGTLLAFRAVQATRYLHREKQLGFAT